MTESSGPTYRGAGPGVIHLTFDPGSISLGDSESCAEICRPVLSAGSHLCHICGELRPGRPATGMVVESLRTQSGDAVWLT